MDPAGGGPGPPRPAPAPNQNIAPAPPEGAPPIFPFNPPQQQPTKGMQIGHGAAPIPIPNSASSPFLASEPFGNNAFLAAIPGKPTSDANPLNQPHNVNPAVSMLHNVNATAANTQPIPMQANQQRQPAPQQLPHQTSRDFFGELEKALSGNGPPHSDNDFDVLDHAIAPGGSQQTSPPQQSSMVSNAVASQPQHAQGIQPWPQSQAQVTAHLQRGAHMQQSHLQSQLQQQQQQQQQHMRQRQLQHQAHMAQQQQLRHQHFQTQQIRQEQFRQQQHYGQLRHLQPQPPQQNSALVNQPHQQAHQPQPTQSPTQSQSQQPQRKQSSLQLPQQPAQSRTHGLHQYAPKHIQPAVILPMHGQGSLPYPAGFVGQPNIGSAGQMRNPLGNAAVAAGGGQSLAMGSAVQHNASAPAVAPAKPKTKSRKSSQRRPRAKAKNIQGKNSQSQSPSPSQSSSQQGPLVAQGPHISARASPEQMNVFAQQQQYVSPPQRIQPASSQLQQTPQQLQQARKHELQTRLLQQRQRPHQASNMHPSLLPMGSSSFVSNTAFPPSEARSSPPHRGMSVAPGRSSPFGAPPVSQSTGFSATANHLPQLPTNELASIGKFDRGTLQKILSQTNDPKLHAMLQQQLQMLQGNGSGQVGNQSHSMMQTHMHVNPHGNVLRQGSAAAKVPQAHAPSSMQHGIGTSPTPSARSTLPTQQQLLQQQQGVDQHQRQQQLQYSQRALGVGQQQQPGNAQIFPRGMNFPHQSSQQSGGLLNPHASQSVASLPQHVQHQIQAQIQARHIQTQLQSQAKLNVNQRSSASTGAGFRGDVQNVTAALPQRSSSPAESRMSRKDAKLSKQNATVSHANGSVASNGLTQTNLQPGMAVGPGKQAPIGGAQFSTQLPMSSVGQGPAPSKIAGLHQTATNLPVNPNPLFENNTSRNSAVRRAAESKKLMAERKRIAQEAESRELAAQKKRRLEAAPGSDYQGILGQTPLTPFAGHVNAWQRLVPFHVLRSADGDSVSSEDWNVGITKLCEKYREGLRDLQKNVSKLAVVDPNFVADEVPGLGAGMLSNDDSILMETVMLEDFDETSRREKALAENKAREIARQRAVEIEASRRATERTAIAAAAAEAAMMVGRERNPSRLDTERSTTMATGSFVQGSPGSSHNVSLPSGTPGGGSSFSPGQGIGILNSASRGSRSGGAPQGVSSQSYQSHIPGFGPTAGRHNFPSNGGPLQPSSAMQSSQTPAAVSGTHNNSLDRYSSGISVAFQHARQAAMPQAQVLGYHKSGRRGSQKITQAVATQQNASVRNHTPVTSQGWGGQEMVSSTMQSGPVISTGAVGGRSNGMNLEGGGQTAVAGVDSHGTTVMNPKAASDALTGHVPQDQQMVQMGTSGGMGTNSAVSRARIQAAKTSPEALDTPQGSRLHSNGISRSELGNGKQSAPSNRHVGNRRVGSNHMMGGQLPTYPASMQAKGTLMPVHGAVQGQAGHNSVRASMSSLHPNTGGMGSVQSSSQLPVSQGVKGSSGQAYAGAGLTPHTVAPGRGASVGHAAGGGQNGGKEKRGMGMGSLLNSERR